MRSGWSAVIAIAMKAPIECPRMSKRSESKASATAKMSAMWAGHP